MSATRPTFSHAEDWQQLGGSVSNQSLSRCPKCDGLRFGSGPHAQRDQRDAAGNVRRVDCRGELVEVAHG